MTKLNLVRLVFRLDFSAGFREPLLPLMDLRKIATCFPMAASSNNFDNQFHLKAIPLLLSKYRFFMTTTTMMSKRDFYQVLGVPKTATQKEIKNAFYSLSKKYHPDVVGQNDSSAKKFVEIKEAYDTLKNEDKRKEYDQYQMRGGMDQSSHSHREYQQYAQQWQQYAHQRQRRMNMDEEYARIWRTMEQNSEFRKAAGRFNEEIKRMREEAFRRQMEERSQRSWNGSASTPPPNAEENDKIALRLLIEKILVFYMFVALVVILIKSFSGDLKTQPHKSGYYNKEGLYYGDYNAERKRRKENETARQAIDDMTRKMP